MQNELTVLILCGGKGERLRPLTNNMPKPLIAVNNKPILSYIFDHLTKYNVNDYVIATGYKSHKIEKYLLELKPKISYKTVFSGDVDIIQRIKDASKYIENDFMVLYGDTISDVDIGRLIEFHRSHNNPITITVWPLRTQFGLVEITEDNDLISSDPLEGEESIDRMLRPQYLSEYVGQEAVKQQMDIFIEAAKKRKESLDHVLIFGPPGLGKTTLAHVIANELGVNLKHTSGPAIEKPGAAPDRHSWTNTKTG